jgi:uncharacterized membrane protein YhaH (DUF805 family)
MEWMILPYKRYAEFSGRSQRKEYWMFYLFSMIVMVVLGGTMLSQLPWQQIMNSGAGVSPFAGWTPGAGLFVSGGLLGIWVLASFIPGIAVTVRRFHDQDMSGWWVLGFAVLGNIPYVGFIASIVQIVLMARKGTVGGNRFGADPLDPTYEGVFA